MSNKRIDVKTMMDTTKHLADQLQPGRVYRRMDLAHHSQSIGQHLNQSLFHKALDSYGNMATRKRVQAWISG